jgi:hypothetical protein
MADLTEKEYDALDEYYTKNTIMPVLGKPGYFARKYGMTVKLDPETTCRIADWAESVHKTPAQIVGELVRKELTAAI